MANDPRFWNILNALTRTKDTTIFDDPDFEKLYNPFVINMALSHHADTVMAANLMNERPGLPAELQATFLLNTIRPRFRKSEWLKSSVSDDVKNVAEYYECSVRQARALVSLHTPEQLVTIRTRLDKGGTTKVSISRDQSRTSSPTRRQRHT